MRLIFIIILVLLFTGSAFSAVDIAPRGKKPVRLEDVYQQRGVPYVAVEDALDAVGLRGHWNSIKHTFRIRTQRGWAEISPASSYLKLGEDYYPLQEKPRFIDGRLRVTDNFIINQLSLLVGRPIYFRNLDPDIDAVTEEEPNTLEQLFAFLLNKKNKRTGPLIRAVALDPGHGGLDTGVIAASGYKEKDVNLSVTEKLAKQLKMKLGVPIYLSRDGDYELTLEQRLKPASREDVDIWLLIHSQASFSPEHKGINLFVRPDEVSQILNAEEDDTNTSPSRELAEQLAMALKESAFIVNGIFPSSLLSLGRGALPTVQIELGYLSNSEELTSLQDAEYQERLALALYQGIRGYAKTKKEITK